LRCQFRRDDDGAPDGRLSEASVEQQGLTNSICFSGDYDDDENGVITNCRNVARSPSSLWQQFF